MRIAGASLMAVIISLMAPISNVSAQTVDYDCVDFPTQADAQVIYDQFPGDPYRLDPDGDGIPCESSSLPSGAQTAGYVGVVLLVVALSGVAIAAWQRRKVVKGVDAPPAHRFDELETGLQAMSDVIGGANFESDNLSSRSPISTSLDGNDGRSLEPGVDRVKALLDEMREEFQQATRRAAKVNLFIAAGVALVSVAGAVIVSIFVP